MEHWRNPCQLILIRELIHTEDGDDILQLVITLQQLLYSLCTIVVRLAHNQRVEDRTVAIIYAIIGLVVNTISALSVKELPEEELNEREVKNDNEKYGMVQAFKLLVKNKYYMMIC